MGRWIDGLVLIGGLPEDEVDGEIEGVERREGEEEATETVPIDDLGLGFGGVKVED